MPSPLGHTLAGVIAGWAVAGRPTRDADRSPAEQSQRVAGDALPFAVLGAAPDLDLLVGLHSMYTHSIGAAALAGLAGWWLARRSRGSPVVRAAVPARLAPRPLRFGIACAAALASHILLDWLGSDTTAPIGIMALWPFSTAYVQSPWFVFDAITRRAWEASFYTHNARAALRELGILSPFLALVWFTRAAVAGARNPGAPTDPRDPAAGAGGPGATRN